VNLRCRRTLRRGHGGTSKRPFAAVARSRSFGQRNGRCYLLLTTPITKQLPAIPAPLLHDTASAGGNGMPGE